MKTDKMKKCEYYVIVFFLVVGWLLFLFAGCGGSSGSGDFQTGDNADAADEMYSSQALLGPIVGASVAVYFIGDLPSEPLCQISTVDDPDLDIAGSMQIPADCVEREGYYLLVAQGGMDIDPDDDGIRDPEPVPLRGKLHALFTREQIETGQAKVTAVTELAYQYVHYLISAGYGDSEIEAALSQVAELILKGDISGDGSIDHLDLAAWHPRLDSSLFRPGLNRLNLIAGTILDGGESHPEAIETIHNITLGVKADFPEFLFSSWIRTAEDFVAIDGRAYRFWEDQAGGFGYDREADSHDIGEFGDYQPVEMVYDNIRFKAFEGEVKYGEEAEGVKTAPRVEISKVRSGELLSTIELPTNVVGMKAMDDRLYLLRDSGWNVEENVNLPGGIDMFDISDPENLALQSFVPMENGGEKWVFHGSEVTVCEPVFNPVGLVIRTFDVSPMGNLAETFSCQTSVFSPVKMRASSSAVLLWSRNHPNTLTFIDKKTGDESKIDFESEIIDFDLSGLNIFALTEDLGLRIIEVGGGIPVAQHPAVRSVFPGGVVSTEFINNELWVLSDTLGNCSVLNFLEPESPEIVSSVNGGFHPVSIDNNHVLAAGFLGMWLYSKDQNQWIGEIVSDSLSWCLGRDEGYVYIASSDIVPTDNNGFYVGNARLDIYPADASQLNMPYSQTSLNHAAQFDDMVVRSENVYLVDYNTDIFEIIDIGNPGQAFSKSILSTGGRRIALHGQYAYIASKTNGIKVVDITDPTSPILASWLDSADAQDLTVSGERLYLADGAGGLKVFDINSDGSLDYISSVLLAGQANAVEANGDWVYVGTDSALYSIRAMSQDIP